ncbi:FMN-binding negative transcriptional regulator [Phreatobacter aquaticus]|uniref:FMN-binding negative transcriptional regulator n=1 Tax=Phreatobacter aquaticus TaxID=2570229 RepID=A0A4D7QKW0_9HYPH|nr:FMN-binding negative transcriptional regulator [Phreatobacter aquaticus]QCK86024.1 FMN-binding negative transcriptional regulator [Phreatobacter aquaticus]
MYVPPLFAMADDAEMAGFCQAHPFAALVTHGPDGLFATHLPVIFKPAEGAKGAFFGHLARANPHWGRAAEGSDALLIFTGAQAYVTPSWYETKKQTAKVVPTWNYSAVHVRGRVSWPADVDFLKLNLADLTAAHEAGRSHPWALSDAPDDFVAMQMRAIVGMRFEVTGFDGKAKLSQNRPAADIDGVVAGLGASDAPMDREVAAQVDKARRR